MLRELREDYSSPFGGWGKTSRGYWLTSVADEFEKRFVDLAEQKSELAPQEELTERAALSTETEEVRLL